MSLPEGHIELRITALRDLRKKSVSFLFLVSFVLFLVSGRLSGQTLNDYQTNGNVTFASATNWQRYDGSAWFAAAVAPASTDNVITVRNGHTATLDASKTLDQLFVEAGGILTVNSTRTLTISDATGTDLDVTGTVNNSGTITPTGTIVFNANSAYNHVRDGGAVPFASWDINSNCNITGVTNTNVVNLPTTTYGNLTWNCPGQVPNAYLNGLNGSTISGDFNIMSTGIRALFVSTGSPQSFSILGDLNISGGIFRLTTSTGTATIDLAGNFDMTGGSLTESGTVDGYINFVNTAQVQNFRRSAGSIANEINFTVNSEVTIDFGTTDYVDGGGTFTLSNGATIQTANTLGLGSGMSIFGTFMLGTAMTPASIAWA